MTMLEALQAMDLAVTDALYSAEAVDEILSTAIDGTTTLKPLIIEPGVRYADLAEELNDALRHLRNVRRMITLEIQDQEDPS